MDECTFFFCFVHSDYNTVVSCVFQGAGPRNQRAEGETSGAEWQKGT